MISAGQKLGRYFILRKIGAGGMGDVYLARDERLERDIALKVLSSSIEADESSRKRFRKEALTLSRLSHPNIATILDYDSQEGVDFLVMEYIAGSSLSQLLEPGPMRERDIIPLAIQVAQALDEAHGRGVVHRDLKPNNMIVTPKGQVKVLDFGLAKIVRPASYDSMTQSAANEANLIIGTLAYMSPEQLRSQPVDARSDVYSFGVVLYEMATGKRPHTQSQPISLADAVLHQVPPPPGALRKDLSPNLQQIILKCLEKDPEKRYQSAREILADLRRAETPSMSVSELVARRRPTGVSVRLRKWMPLAAFVMILATIFLGVWISRGTGKATPEPQVVPEIRSIVALPSKVYGMEENQFLSDAIPDALSVYLSRIEGMETKVPPTSIEVERLKGDFSRIGEVFAVSALVSSSLTSGAGRLILNIQLVEASSRKLLWSNNYEAPTENYLDLVRNAAEGLQAALRPGTAPVAAVPGLTRSTEAEFAFRRGIHYLLSYANLKKTEDFDMALADLRQALELDPTNARAAASIARLHLARIESGASLGEILPEIDSWTRRALELDFRCGEAWQVLSVAEEMRPNSDKRRRLEYALRAATYAGHSGYSHHALGAALSRSSLELGLEASLEGTRREPMHLNGKLFTAGMLSRLNRVDDGLRSIDEVLGIQPEMPIAVIMKVWLLLRDHRPDEADKWGAKLDALVAGRRLHPGWVDFSREWLAFEKNVAAGDSAAAVSALAQLVEEARGNAPPFPRWEVITGNVIGIQAERDTAASTLETLAIRKSKGIVEPYDWLLQSAELKQVRKESGFQEILPPSRAEFQNMLSILQEAQQRGELPAYLKKTVARLRKLS